MKSEIYIDVDYPGELELDVYEVVNAVRFEIHKADGDSMVDLSRADVARLHSQLGEWLELA